MPYPVPPWLGVSPPDFGRAAAEGAGIRVQKARIAEEARQANMRASMAAAELSAKQQQQQAALAKEQTDAEFQRQFQQTQLGLHERQLDQEEQRITQTVQQASQKFAVQQQAAERIRGGEEPSKVWAELGPMIGMTGSGMNAILRGRTGGPPSAEDVPGLPGYVRLERSPGNYQFIRKATIPDAIRTIPVVSPTGETNKDFFGVPGASGVATVHPVHHATEGEALQETLRQKQAQINTRKRERAEELAKQHPKWTKQDIIDAVHKEFSQ